MAQQEQKTGAWGVFVTLVLFIGFLATWMLIPSTALEATWRAEQEQMTAMAGEGANQWVLLESANVRADSAASAKTSAAGLTNSRFDTWLLDRIYATLLWVSVITYRAQALLMWSLIGIPLILAASVDGFYVREIRKMAFTSQSPIRHKIGIHAFKAVSLAMVAWLCLPIPMPIVAAPAVVCFVAVSLWLWVANLQKRL